MAIKQQTTLTPFSFIFNWGSQNHYQFIFRKFNKQKSINCCVKRKIQKLKEKRKLVCIEDEYKVNKLNNIPWKISIFHLSANCKNQLQSVKNGKFSIRKFFFLFPFFPFEIWKTNISFLINSGWDNRNIHHDSKWRKKVYFMKYFLSFAYFVCNGL